LVIDTSKTCLSRPADDSYDDSWGETESDDSYEDEGYIGPYPFPVYVQPQPIFAPQPMYYRTPRRRRKNKKKIVFQEPPKPYTMDQSTYTIDHRATQWDDPDAGQLMDVGVDPMRPYVQTIDRSSGTFDVRRGGTDMSRASNKTTASERERRRKDRERWERERQEYEDFERRRHEEMDQWDRELAERNRQLTDQDRSYQERKGALDRDRAYREKMAREQERNRGKHGSGIDFVPDDSGSEGHSDLYYKLKARQAAIDYVADDTVPEHVARQLQEDSSLESHRGPLKSGTLISMNSRHPVGSVKSYSGSVHSLPASYKNDPKDLPPRSSEDYRPASYEEITIPVPNVYGSYDNYSSTQTLAPARAPKFYYHYTQTRPRYLQDRNLLFDERNNSVLKRYKVKLFIRFQVLREEQYWNEF
jgi:hypothetical protein